jgi:hypothetical protein
MWKPSPFVPLSLKGEGEYFLKEGLAPLLDTPITLGLPLLLPPPKRNDYLQKVFASTKHPKNTLAFLPFSPHPNKAGDWGRQPPMVEGVCRVLKAVPLRAGG